MSTATPAKVPGVSAPLRALIYNRASADPTGRGISTASQNRENREFCARQGWQVVDAVTDDAQSASRFATKARKGHPGVLEAITGSGYGRIDVLVMTAADRGERTLDGHVELRRLCAKHDVLLAYRGKVHNMRDPADRFAAGLDALIAERETDEISQRMLRSHRDSRERGAPRGAIPYGYIHEYDPATGAMARRVPDPLTAPIVQEVVHRVLRGDTLFSIAADLNRRGVPTPQARRDRAAGRDTTRTWNITCLKHMLGSRAFIGVRTYEGKPVRDGTWPAIVSADDWEQVQRILADPHRATEYRGCMPRHLLSGIATCGVCDGPLRPTNSHGVKAYTCAGVHSGAPRGHVSRAREPLERFVTRPLLRRMQRPDILALLAPATGGEDGAAEARRELADLEARLAGFVASAAEGGISPQSLAAIEAQLLPRIAQARQMAVPRLLPKPVVDLAGAHAEQLWARWGEESDGIIKQRLVVRALLCVVVHRSTVRGPRVFDASSVELTWRGEVPSS